MMNNNLSVPLVTICTCVLPLIVLIAGGAIFFTVKRKNEAEKPTLGNEDRAAIEGPSSEGEEAKKAVSETMGNICQACGADNPMANNFCEHCGSKLSP
jgi:ribosomal protein L40E